MVSFYIKMNSDWTLVIADAPDIETAGSIVEFITSFPGPDYPRKTKDYSADSFYWKLSCSPGGPGFVSLAMDGEKMIGAAAYARRTFYFHGEVVYAAELVDAYTLPDYRGRGIFSSLVDDAAMRALENDVSFAYSVPTPGLGGYTAEINAGFVPAKNVGISLNALSLKPVEVARTKRGRTGQSAFLDDAIKAVAKAVCGESTALCREQRLEFGDEFEALNDELRMNFDFMASRSPDCLNYRVAQNPDLRYGLITNRSKEGKLRGALVFKEMMKDDLKVLYVADCWGGGRDTAREMWRCAVRTGLERECHMVAIWMPPGKYTTARTAPLVPLPVEEKQLLIHREGLGRDILDDRGPRRFAILDSDSI